MAVIPFERPGLPTCYFNTSCVVKTEAEVQQILDNISRIVVEDHIQQYWKKKTQEEKNIGGQNT